MDAFGAATAEDLLLETRFCSWTKPQLQKSKLRITAKMAAGANAVTIAISIQ